MRRFGTRVLLVGSRLEAYDRLVRAEGWFVFAVHATPPVIEWLDRRGYPFRVYIDSEVPPDYPKSFFWKPADVFRAEGGQWDTYLIVAKKIGQPWKNSPGRDAEAAPPTEPPRPALLTEPGGHTEEAVRAGRASHDKN